MSECESTRGKWSTPTKTNVCPDCKAPMPVDKPLSAPGWKSRSHDQRKVTNEAGLLGNPILPKQREAPMCGLPTISGPCAYRKWHGGRCRSVERIEKDRRYGRCHKKRAA